MKFYTRENDVDEDYDIEETNENFHKRDDEQKENTSGCYAGCSYSPQCCPPPYPPCPYPPYPYPPYPPYPYPPYPPYPRKKRPHGTIIPFASGNSPVTLTTVADGLPGIGYVSAIGFGQTQNGITISAGGELSLPAGNMAFSVPRHGRITSVSAYFTNTLPITLDVSVLQISAQLYYTASPGNVFLPLSGTKVNLTPTLTGTVPADSVYTASVKNLSVHVARGTRLVLVFSVSVVGAPTLDATLTGYASAGVNIK